VVLCRVLQLVVTANILLDNSYQPDDEGDTFSETCVLTRATRHHIPEDGFLYHNCEYESQSVLSNIHSVFNIFIQMNE
jgi:hypothetical protein